MEKAIVSEIITSNFKKELPTLLNFQNGKLNEEYTSVAVTTVAVEKTSKKDAAIVAVNDSVYHGLIGDNFPTDLVDTFMAIRNKKTNKIRLIQVNQCTLMHSVYAQKPKVSNDELDKSVLTKQLIKNFGSRKAKISMERMERSKVNVDVIKTHLENTIDEPSFHDDNNISHATEQVDICPPHNKDAKHFEDIYTLTDILPQSFLDSLNGEAKAVMKHPTDELPISSEFIRKEINAIKNSGSRKSEENITKLKILIYLDGLLAYIKCRTRNMVKVELSKISDKITNDICIRFSPKNSTKLMRTKEMCDKACCYFIVLILLISPKFELDVNILTAELSKSRKQICNYAFACNASLKKQSNIITFRLPGNATQPSFRKRKTM